MYRVRTGLPSSYTAKGGKWSNFTRAYTQTQTHTHTHTHTHTEIQQFAILFTVLL